MKKYIGTKEVMAEPMLKSVAVANGWARTSNDKVDLAGYHVQYNNPDGTTYDSWSPKDVFEKSYKCAETYVNRLYIELEDVESRHKKLAAFLESEYFRKIKEEGTKFLLTLQSIVMTQYSCILSQRINDKFVGDLPGMPFGIAIEALKFGLPVRRKGWKNAFPPIVKPFPQFNPTKRVEYNADYDLVYIQTKDGSVAVTDGAFYDIVSKYTWDKDGNGYISASFKDNGKVHPHKLQNYIISNIPNGYIVDHINGNKLDNRMCNLRFATIKENNANRASKQNSSSRYKGVSFDRSRGKWISSIQIYGKTKHIGRFDDEYEAAIAYDTESLKVYGVFARLNFPKMLEAPFIVKQVPSHITGDIIPNMQSLPQSAKDILMSRENPHIDYINQILIIHPDGRADSWTASSSDIFADDWEIVMEE